jgi:hypothetical protein
VIVVFGGLILLLVILGVVLVAQAAVAVLVGVLVVLEALDALEAVLVGLVGFLVIMFLRVWLVMVRGLILVREWLSTLIVVGTRLRLVVLILLGMTVSILRRLMLRLRS